MDPGFRRLQTQTWSEVLSKARQRGRTRDPARPSCLECVEHSASGLPHLFAPAPVCLPPPPPPCTEGALMKYPGGGGKSAPARRPRMQTWPGWRPSKKGCPRPWLVHIQACVTFKPGVRGRRPTPASVLLNATYSAFMHSALPTETKGAPRNSNSILELAHHGKNFLSPKQETKGV